MRSAFKYRIYPTEPQAVFLARELKEACSLYNAALQERSDAWKTCRKSINYYDQANQLKAMRADGCLTLANFSCCQDVLRRIKKAFDNFFRRVALGDPEPGYPRYRSFRRYDSITFPSYGDGCRLLANGKLRVQGAGHIKVKLHRPIEGEIKTVTIKRQAGRWFAIFSVEREGLLLPASSAEVGIDVGLTTFAVLSNGAEIENPRHYRNAQARLRCAHRKVARRKNKRSNRRRKAIVLLQRADAHVANQRRDFQHKESRKIVNAFGLIAVEDLQIKNMSRSAKGTVDKPGRNVKQKAGLNRSILDAGWSQFVSMLEYKAEWAGRRVVQVDPRGTSQTCLCGACVPKTLKDRWHDCAVCGLSAGRDHVSAQVILSRALNAGLESGTGDSAGQPSGANVEEVASCVA
jgi:putative transposase